MRPPAAAPAVAGPSPAERLAPITATAGILLFGAWGGLLGPLLPRIAASFHTAVEVAGLLLGITFGGAIVVVIGGYLADHYGKKPLFLVAISGLAAAFFLFAIAPAFWTVAIACFLGGAVGGTLEGLCSAIIADLQTRHVGRNMVLLQAAYCLGAVVALFIAGRLVGAGEAWRGAYALLAGACVLIGIGGALMRVPPAPPAERITLARARTVVSNPFVLLLALAICLYVGSEMSLGSWASRIFALSRPGAGAGVMMGSGVFWLAMGIGRLLIGVSGYRAADRTVLHWLVRGGLLAYLLLLLPLPDWRLWAGVIAAGFLFSAIWPLIISQGNSYYPAYSGTVVSLLVASGAIGAMIFPPLCGFLIERASPTLGIALMAVLFLALAMVIEIYQRRLRADLSPLAPREDGEITA